MFIRREKIMKEVDYNSCILVLGPSGWPPVYVDVPIRTALLKCRNVYVCGRIGIYDIYEYDASHITHTNRTHR